MVSIFKKSAAAAATLLCMGAAQAGVISTLIDFETVDTTNAPFAPLLGDGDRITQAGIWMDPFSNSGLAQPGDLVGALVDGSTVGSTCDANLPCPTNNSTTFYTSLNDAVLYIGNESGLSFGIDRFDAAFVGDRTGLNTISGRIIMQGVRASDGAQLGFVAANLTSTNFASFTMSAGGSLRNTAWSSMFIYAQTCNTAGSCSSFNSDRGQFALDNLRLNVIPEPTSLALVAAAFAGLGAVRRRRQA